MAAVLERRWVVFVLFFINRVPFIRLKDKRWLFTFEVFAVRLIVCVPLPPESHRACQVG